MRYYFSRETAPLSGVRRSVVKHVTMISINEVQNTKLQSHHTLPIAIVGGGLGGLALAIGLAKYGIKVHIYESTAAFSEIGAGVSFSVNTMTALQLIDPRLFEGYMKHATFNAGRKHDSTFFTVRWGMDERKESGHKPGDLMWDLVDKRSLDDTTTSKARARSCIHRTRLLDELVALLPKNIATFGKSFEDVAQLGDGTLQLRFAIRRWNTCARERTHRLRRH